MMQDLEAARSQERLDELVLYVSFHLADSPNFGMVALNKALFFSEMLHYVEYGHAITGATYTRQRFGPTLHQMLPVIRRLEASHDAVVRNVPVGTYTQKRLVAQREARSSLFDASELKTVNGVLNMCRNFTGTQLSEMSHNLPGWRLARDGEEIPFFTAFIYEGPPSEHELEVSRRLVRRLNL